MLYLTHHSAVSNPMLSRWKCIHNFGRKTSQNLHNFQDAPPTDNSSSSKDDKSVKLRFRKSSSVQGATVVCKYFLAVQDLFYCENSRIWCMACNSISKRKGLLSELTGTSEDMGMRCHMMIVAFVCLLRELCELLSAALIL